MSTSSGFLDDGGTGPRFGIGAGAACNLFGGELGGSASSIERLRFSRWEGSSGP